MSAQAHCDAVDGPVATAAAKALDTRNVNLMLPFAPAQAEPELSAAFEQALAVRGKGPKAKTLADRYFMETQSGSTALAKERPIPVCSRPGRISALPSPQPKQHSKRARRIG
jgi:hypothetical protein